MILLKERRTEECEGEVFHLSHYLSAILLIGSRLAETI
jgi:hypothetical protein